jgi:DNA transformation protein
MAAAQEFATHIVDLLDPFGPCEARRMFGGFGIFHQGLMFGLIADGDLYLKADAASRALFEAEDSTAFSYYKKEKEYKLAYYLAPEEFFEDPEACLRWAQTAFDAALRNPKKVKSKTDSE